MNYTIKGKEKGTIFCIHGNSSSSNVFDDLLNSDKVLNTKIAIDLNGHSLWRAPTCGRQVFDA